MGLIQIFRYFTREGVSATLLRILIVITQIFLKYSKIYFYQLDVRDHGSKLVSVSPVSFRLIDNSEIGLLSSIMYHSKKNIENRFIQGDRCLIGSINNKIIYFSWVARTKMIIPEIDKEILLDKDTAYVYNVRTAKKYRGKGISSYAYSLIAGHLRDSGYKHLRVVVAKSNIASIKSIEKAGFKKRQQITYYRLLSVFKKYYVKNY